MLEEHVFAGRVDRDVGDCAVSLSPEETSRKSTQQERLYLRELLSSEGSVEEIQI